MMHPATKKLLEYGLVGLVIATGVIAGVQLRPSSLLPSNGIVQLLITDDPLTVTCPHPQASVTFTSLMVNISSVEVHRSGALNLTSEWITLINSPQTIDILKLKNATQLLGSKSLPEGTITSIRLNVTSVVAHTSSGSVSLRVPSGTLRASLGPVGEVRSGMTTSVVADVQPHIVCEGNGTIRVTPVLTATVRGPN